MVNDPFSFAVPIVACIVADRPSDVKCTALVANESPSHLLQGGRDEARLPYRTAVGKLLRDPLVLATMLGLFGTGWVREGFLSWFGSYLFAVADISVGSAGHSAAAMAITLGGMAGSLSVGVISDRCCTSNRAPVVLACTILQGILLLIFPVAMRAAATFPTATSQHSPWRSPQRSR